MPEAYYAIADQSPVGAAVLTQRVESSGHTAGPWSAGLSHAGPPAALLTRAVTHLPGAPVDALAARLCFDILSPIPVADLVVTARVTRPGSRVALAGATLSAADDLERPLMTLRAWLVRQRADDGRIPEVPEVPAPPEVRAPVPRPVGWSSGYIDSVAWTWVDGSFQAPGPATVWSELVVDLIDGERPTPLQRMVAVADSASGISSVADPAALLFVNTDLTLHLTRPPQGKSFWMRARTDLGRTGIGRATGELGDAGGMVATSAQCLFVEPRT